LAMMMIVAIVSRISRNRHLAWTGVYTRARVIDLTSNGDPHLIFNMDWSRSVLKFRSGASRVPDKLETCYNESFAFACTFNTQTLTRAHRIEAVVSICHPALSDEAAVGL